MVEARVVARGMSCLVTVNELNKVRQSRWRRLHCSTTYTETHHNATCSGFLGLGIPILVFRCRCPIAFIVPLWAYRRAILSSVVMCNNSQVAVVRYPSVSASFWKDIIACGLYSRVRTEDRGREGLNGARGADRTDTKHSLFILIGPKKNLFRPRFCIDLFVVETVVLRFLCRGLSEDPSLVSIALVPFSSPFSVHTKVWYHSASSCLCPVCNERFPARAL